jgi:uncharacterized protein (TIGR04255 family)
MSQKLSIEPAAGKHAIEVIALAVEWGRPLSEEELHEVAAIYRASDTLTEFFPRIEEIKGLTVSLDSEDTKVSAPVMGGLQIVRAKDDGSPSWMVHVRPELISCNCMEYDRWRTVKPKALEALLPIVKYATAKGHPIQAIGLQYHDMFRVKTASHADATGRMFRRDSRWLSPRIWEEDGPWHIHQGWFSPGKLGRVDLNLLNVDVVTEQQGCVFRIFGQHRALTVTRQGEAAAPFTTEDLSSVFESLHTCNKSVLLQLLAQNVCDQIGLTLLETA